MPSVAIHTILGPLPLLRGLFRWSLAVLFAVGAWHLYLWSPLPGLVAIGITPVLAIFFFFRGLNLVSRTLPYWKTRRLIRKLGMHPTWWNTGAGYLLIDERQGSWIINGTAGMIVDIKRLHGHSDWQMHRLDLYTTDTPKPTASYGFGSAEGDPRSCENFPKGLCPTGKKRPSRHIRGLTEKRKQSLRSALKTNPFL